MPFQMAVRDSIGRSSTALNILQNYNGWDHANAPQNKAVRNDARITIDGAAKNLNHELNVNARWEGVPQWAGNNARQAQRALEAATWSLSEKRQQPANVPLARQQIRDAIDFLRRT